MGKLGKLPNYVSIQFFNLPIYQNFLMLFLVSCNLLINNILQLQKIELTFLLKLKRQL